MKMLFNSSQSFSSIFLFIKVLTLFYLTTLIKPVTCNTNNNYHFNCGTPSATTALHDQIWHTDEDPTFAPLSAYTAATKAAVATTEDPYVSSEDDVLSLVCKAARTFHAPFTYSFPVSYGPKFVRLTFCALGSTYDNTSSELFYLSLQANGGSGSFNLLHNYSAYLHEKQFKHTYSAPISKEFLVMATSSRLNLTFSPTSPANLGFVNGIEIVDVPDHLYDYLIPQSIEDSQNSSAGSPCLPATLASSQTTFTMLGPAALETIARLNVGGADIGPANDSGGMARAWYEDSINLDQTFSGSVLNNYKSKIHYTTSVPEHTAPGLVYGTARVMGPNNKTFNDNQNLTWEFNVDSGFIYLVRLHFCEIDSQVKKVGEREFDILINSAEVKNGVDVMSLTNDKQMNSPACMDYVADNVGDMTSTNVSLRLTLRPDIKNNPWYHDVILNGIEIFKLNQSGGNLAGLNPALPPDDIKQFNKSQSFRRGSESSHLHTIEIVVGSLGSLVILPILIALAYRCWKYSNLEKSSLSKSRIILGKI